MKVLGVNIGHDSSAALVIDGRIIASMAEERFTRIKHFSGLPIRSVEHCLRMGEITMESLDAIALSSKGYIPEANDLFELRGARRESPSRGALRAVFSGREPERGLPRDMPRFPVSNKTAIVHVEHHLAHAASAYFTSGTSEKQLVVTMDGIGDGMSCVIWRGEGGKLTPLERYGANASLGWFYSNITEALGWWHGDGEGTTMGLAPYGDATKARDALEPYYPIFSNGSLVREHDFGPVSAWDDAGAIHYHLHESDQIAKLVKSHGPEAIAAAAQQILEEQALQIILPWLDRENSRRLSCAGGVFLNVKLNQRVWESGKVDAQHIFPDSGDAGTAVGAALSVYYGEHPDAPIQEFRSAYLGPLYSDAEIEALLKARHLRFSREGDIARSTAKLLAENKSVAWFQGRMECGPRALGGRSILMSPVSAENKDKINATVKFRQPFRPFCPSILAEEVDNYFVRSRPERFMITSFEVKPEKREEIPAVVHVDGTARPQSVEEDVNPLFARLLREFHALTGVPALLNTSLNIKGEPMICHPREAIRCFFDSGLDHLVLGDYLLSKGDN